MMTLFPETKTCLPSGEAAMSQSLPLLINYTDVKRVRARKPVSTLGFHPKAGSATSPHQPNRLNASCRHTRCPSSLFTQDLRVDVAPLPSLQVILTCNIQNLSCPKSSSLPILSEMMDSTRELVFGVDQWGDRWAEQSSGFFNSQNSSNNNTAGQGVSNTLNWKRCSSFHVTRTPQRCCDIVAVSS